MAQQGKKAAGEKSVDFVEQDMVIGLGTGSTVYWAIQKLKQRLQEGLRTHVVPTSKATEKLATEAGIPLISFEQVNLLDLTIDGADEADPQLNLIKGGGGALLREKLVAVSSKRVIIVVDSSKCVQVLGKFPLPVEIVPFSWEHTQERVSSTGCRTKLRKNGDTTFITDNGNYILDCHFGEIKNPAIVHEQLKLLPGVIETGLFIQKADIIIVGNTDRVEVIQKKGG